MMRSTVLTVFVVLSLVAAPAVSACACDHHAAGTTATPAPACHDADPGPAPASKPCCCAVQKVDDRDRADVAAPAPDLAPAGFACAFVPSAPVSAPLRTPAPFRDAGPPVFLLHQTLRL